MTARRYFSGKDLDSPTVVNFANGLKKGFVVLLVKEDFLPRASTIHDVIDGFRIQDTGY